MRNRTSLKPTESTVLRDQYLSGESERIIVQARRSQRNDR
jgi:hypothetical protein